MAKKSLSPHARQLRYQERVRINAVRGRYINARAEGMSMEDAADYANGRPVAKAVVEYQTRCPFPMSNDDLTLITGIGAGTLRKLNDIGVVSFKQIADWTDDEARSVDENLGLKGRVFRHDWIGQAKALMGA